MKNGITVLSLFDGISCGQVALEKANIKIHKYYASEIDRSAIKVTLDNYPNTIQLGDVQNWKSWNIDWSEIDLLIGGSPCQGFSFAGKKLNFNDERSKLFFEFSKILNHIKKNNPKVMFLLENVKMKKEWQNIITEYLGAEPIEINSKLVSPQNRPRLYWTNIENINTPANKNLVFKDIIENYDFDNHSKEFKEYNNFYVIPRAKDGELINGSYNRIWKIESYCGALSVCNIPKVGKIENGVLKYRKITLNEAIKMQNIPKNFFKNVDKNTALKQLGNGWTVDVITHIFSFIQ